MRGTDQQVGDAEGRDRDVNTSDVTNPQFEMPTKVRSSGCSLEAVGAEGDAGSSGTALLLAGAALAVTRQRRRK